MSPYNLPMCFDAQEVRTAHTTQKASNTNNASILTESEKARLLEEVNAQQADFGLQK